MHLITLLCIASRLKRRPVSAQNLRILQNGRKYKLAMTTIRKPGASSAMSDSVVKIISICELIKTVSLKDAHCPIQRMAFTLKNQQIDLYCRPTIP